MKTRGRLCPWCKALVLFTGTAQYELAGRDTFAINLRGEIARVDAYVRHACTAESDHVCDG